MDTFLLSESESVQERFILSQSRLPSQASNGWVILQHDLHIRGTGPRPVFVLVVCAVVCNFGVFFFCWTDRSCPDQVFTYMICIIHCLGDLSLQKGDQSNSSFHAQCGDGSQPNIFAVSEFQFNFSSSTAPIFSCLWDDLLS